MSRTIEGPNLDVMSEMDPDTILSEIRDIPPWSDPGTKACPALAHQVRLAKVDFLSWIRRLASFSSTLSYQRTYVCPQRAHG